ncbi:MAG: Zn-ribbon domain-containing OB-fold protein [Syntrophales bacterium]
MKDAKPTCEGRIKVPYKWFVGETGSRFFTALRDRCEIWGTRCSRCNKVYVPPVKNCWGCFQPLDEWVPVSDSGVVESFTVARCPDAMFGLDPPVVCGLIRLGKASGSLLHYIGEVKPEEVKVGMRVKAVFADRRSGNILDIKYFAPVRE